MAGYLKCVLCLLTIGALFCIRTPSLLAQETVTKDSLVRALKARSNTRATRGISIGGVGPTVQQKSLIRSLARRTTRQITVEERKEITKIVKTSNSPTINLTIYFNHDSAVITQRSLPTLVKLGQALSDKQLKNAIFLIAGHTDASGSNEYNLSLSQRRAETVKAFLGKSFGLAAKGLVAIGYGEEQLRHVDDPTSGDNRRVQISNLTQ